MKLETLNDLYLHCLMDAYDAEKQIIQALPKMISATTAPDLKEAFEEHLEQTKEQKARLEEIINALETKPKEVTCKGMKGVLEEGQEVLKIGGNPEVIDAALIGAAQKVEHYEIASYGTLEAFAEILGEDDALEIITEIKDQEIETDEKLTELAQSSVNDSALDEADLDDDEDVEDEEEK